MELWLTPSALLCADCFGLREAITYLNKGGGLRADSTPVFDWSGGASHGSGGGNSFPPVILSQRSDTSTARAFAAPPTEPSWQMRDSVNRSRLVTVTPCHAWSCLTQTSLTAGCFREQDTGMPLAVTKGEALVESRQGPSLRHLPCFLETPWLTCRHNCWGASRTGCKEGRKGHAGRDRFAQKRRVIRGQTRWEE